MVLLPPPERLLPVDLPDALLQAEAVPLLRTIRQRLYRQFYPAFAALADGNALLDPIDHQHRFSSLQQVFPLAVLALHPQGDPIGADPDLAQQVGAAAVIRGVRNTTDFEYERTMAATNRRLYPAVVTVMLFTPPDVADISSSTVREVLAFGRSVAEFLPRGIELENYL